MTQDDLNERQADSTNLALKVEEVVGAASSQKQRLDALSALAVEQKVSSSWF